jgi:hypothetical protein
MKILLIGHVLVRNDIRVVSQIALGKFLVSKLVGDNERQSQDQNDDDLSISL